MPRYQLLATDLDGTMFGHDLVVRPRTRAALARWQAAGRTLVLATGRMFHSARAVAAELGVTTPVICYQGAMIRCPVTERAWLHRPLPLGPLSAAITHLEAAGFTVLGFLDDAVHARSLNEETRYYCQLSRVEARVVPDWRALFDAGLPTKLVAVHTPEAVAQHVAELRPALAGALHVMTSIPPFLEIVHPEANKGNALRVLCAQLGVPIEATIGVGDGQNDLELIDAAALGVAMESGHPDLRARADRLTGSLAEEGLAALIEDLLASDQ